MVTICTWRELNHQNIDIVPDNGGELRQWLAIFICALKQLYSSTFDYFAISVTGFIKLASYL